MKRTAAVIVLLALGAGPAWAQAASQATAARDSLLACARREAGASGFVAAGAPRPGRLLMMRRHESPAASQLLDALRVSVSDSAGPLRLEVRVGSFLVSRSTGLSEEEVTPRAALQAFADSLKARCQP